MFFFPLVWLLNSMTKRCESHQWTSVCEDMLQDPTYESRIVWQQGIRIPMSILWSIMYPYSLFSSSGRSFINLITVIEFKMRKVSLHTAFELVQASPSAGSSTTFGSSRGPSASSGQVPSGVGSAVGLSHKDTDDGDWEERCDPSSVWLEHLLGSGTCMTCGWLGFLFMVTS